MKLVNGFYSYMPIAMYRHSAVSVPLHNYLTFIFVDLFRDHDISADLYCGEYSNCLFNKIVISFIRANHFCAGSAAVDWKIDNHKVQYGIFGARFKSASSTCCEQNSKRHRSPFSFSPTQNCLDSANVGRYTAHSTAQHTHTPSAHIFRFVCIRIYNLNFTRRWCELPQLLLFSWLPQNLHLNGNGNVGAVAIVPSPSYPWNVMRALSTQNYVRKTIITIKMIKEFWFRATQCKYHSMQNPQILGLIPFSVSQHWLVLRLVYRVKMII